MTRPAERRRGRSVVPLLVTLALAAGACTGHGSSPPTTPRTSSSASPTRGGSPSPSLQIGTVKVGGFTSSQCPPGFRCQQFEVACVGLQQADRGLLEVEGSTSHPRGMVLYFSGESGQRPWVTPSTAQATLPFVNGMAQAGFVNVLVAWVQPWLIAGPGEEAGPARLACRAASVIRYVHDTMYAPLNAHPAPRQCGFCLVGESGGASEIAYALSRYGLAGIVDEAVMLGGMPFASIQKGCLQTTSPYYYGPTATGFIDAAYGFPPSSPGPCSAARASFRNRWIADSVNAPGALLSYPDTGIEIIEGGEDTSPAIPLGHDYIDALRAAGTPFLHVQVVPGLSHGAASDPQGLLAVRAALLPS
jgi:hypothetical protein